MKIGDAVATVTKAFGIEPCDACEERRKKLNEFGATMARLFGGHSMQAEDGPTCQCGKPSTHESGWCGECIHGGGVL